MVPLDKELKFQIHDNEYCTLLKEVGLSKTGTFNIRE